jgi:hypothetical protein
MIWDNPEHRVTLTSLSSTRRDDGGGTAPVFATLQSSIPCLINTASASEVEKYAQFGITVTHTISIKSSLLTATVARGVKATAGDTGVSYHVRGIRKGRAFMGVPAFTYLDVEEQL